MKDWDLFTVRTKLDLGSPGKNRTAVTVLNANLCKK